MVDDVPAIYPPISLYWIDINQRFSPETQIFIKFKEIKQLSGTILGYAKQTIAKIDIKIEQKGH
jgi:hypothetical protein